ncbi:MAG TPA: CdaR family protein [Polyangiales bacterium]
MTAEATIGQRLRRALTDNLGLKLFSLMVAIALFTVVHGSEAGQRSLYVPVVAMLPPESTGNILVGELPDKVKVTLSGSRSVVNSIHEIDPVQIDLTRAPRTYTFEPSLFGLPAGIDVQATPAALTLDWEPRQEAKLPVRLQLSGTPAPSLELVGKPLVSPARVMVKGPRSSIEAMSELPTDLLPLANLSAGTHRVRVPLLSLPQGVSVSGSLEVTAELTLELKREQRKLRHLTVAALGIAGSALIRPPHVDVVIAAPERTLEELDPEHVVPVIEVPADAKPGLALSLPVTLRGVDDSMRVIRIEPSEVLVRVH